MGLGRVGLIRKKNTGWVTSQPLFALGQKNQVPVEYFSSQVRKFWPVLPCLTIAVDLFSLCENCKFSYKKLVFKIRYKRERVNTKFPNCRKSNNWKEIWFANINLNWCIMSTISISILLQKNTLWFFYKRISSLNLTQTKNLLDFGWKMDWMIFTTNL